MLKGDDAIGFIERCLTLTAASILQDTVVSPFIFAGLSCYSWNLLSLDSVISLNALCKGIANYSR